MPKLCSHCQPHTGGTHRTSPHCHQAQPAPPAPPGKHSTHSPVAATSKHTAFELRHVFALWWKMSLGPAPLAPLTSSGGVVTPLPLSSTLGDHRCHQDSRQDLGLPAAPAAGRGHGSSPERQRKTQSRIRPVGSKRHLRKWLLPLAQFLPAEQPKQTFLSAIMGGSSWVTPAAFPLQQGRNQEAKSGTLAQLLSEKCHLFGQRPEKISLSTRLYFRDTQLQRVISLISPGPSTGWRDHQGEERGFQQIECFVLQGQGWQPGPSCSSISRWESKEQEETVRMGHHLPGAGCAQPSLRGRMTPLGRPQGSPAVSLTSPHGRVGVLRADPPLEGSNLGWGMVCPNSGTRHHSWCPMSPEGLRCPSIMPQPF